MSLFDEDPQDPRTMAPVTKTPTPIAQINAGMAPPNVSRWDKIKAAIGNAGTTALTNLMPDQKNLEGLLSPTDFADSRREGLLSLGLSLLGDSGYRPSGEQVGFGEALAHGVKAAQGAYQDKIGGLLQSQEYGQAARARQSLAASRAAIAKKYQAPPNETPEQAEQRLKSMFVDYSAAGDTEMTARLSEVVKGLHAAKQSSVGHVDLGDRVEVIDPKTGNVIRSERKGPVPKDPNAPAAATDHYKAEQTNKILDDFRSESADYRKAAAGYEVLKGALKNPGLAQPFAVLDAYARVVNPGAVVRQGTMQVLQEMGSYDQKMRRWLEMAKRGEWPKDMLEGIKSTIDSIMDEHKRTYGEMRKRALERGRRSGVDLDALIDGKPDDPAPNASAPAAPGKFSQDNPFAKK